MFIFVYMIICLDFINFNFLSAVYTMSLVNGVQSKYYSPHVCFIYLLELSKLSVLLTDPLVVVKHIALATTPTNS